MGILSDDDINELERIVKENTRLSEKQRLGFLRAYERGRNAIQSEAKKNRVRSSHIFYVGLGLSSHEFDNLINLYDSKDHIIYSFDDTLKFAYALGSFVGVLRFTPYAILNNWQRYAECIHTLKGRNFPLYKMIRKEVRAWQGRLDQNKLDFKFRDAYASFLDYVF